MKCKKCGTINKKDYAFCGGCGAPIPKKSKAPLYISMISVVAILAVAAIVGILSYNSNAYDRQIELGYELLGEGNYKEAILAFDKAIEIEEKRPEGYMGKAESLAHDPEMTIEKAEKIVGVLEEGYKKSKDKKVLEHKKKVAKILRDNGFGEAAEIVESAGEEKSKSEDKEAVSKEMQVYNYIAFFGDKAVETSGKGLYIRNLETDKRELIFEGTVGSSFATDGQIVYLVKEDTDELYKLDINKRVSEKLIKIKPSEDYLNYMESEIPQGQSVEECYVIGMVGLAGDYIHFNNSLMVDCENFTYNIKTNTYEPSKISAASPRMVSYKDKIYYDEDFADTSCDPIYMANADGSGETIIEKHILNFKVKGNKMYILCTDSEDGYLTGDFGRTFYKEYNMDTGEKKEISEEKIYSVAGFGLDYGSNYDYENPEYWVTVKGGIKKTGKGNIRGNDARSFFTTTEEVLVLEKGDYTVGYEYNLLFDDRMSSAFEIGEGGEIVGYNDGKVYYTEGDTYNSEYEIKSKKLTFTEYSKEKAEDKPKTDESYKKEYAAFLKNRLQVTKYDDEGFTLAYIDSDDIPELVYSYGTSHAAATDIFSIEDGKMVKLTIEGNESDSDGGTFGSNGCVSYVEKAGLISSFYSGMGADYESIYTIEKGYAKEVCDLYRDWNDESNIKYKLNGKSVSEEEYKKEKSKYESKQWTNSMGDDSEYYKLTLENIERKFGE